VKIKIAWIGKTREPAIQALTDEYLKRVGRYTEIEGVALKDEFALHKLQTRGGQLVVLDGRGKQFSSEELAEWIGNYQRSHSSPLLFAIGPADGFGEEIRRSATLVLSLGKMTLPHELARVVLLEQVYRAFTILKGHPYHTGH